MMLPGPPPLLPGTEPASLEERAKVFAEFRSCTQVGAEWVLRSRADVYERSIANLADECMKTMYLMVGIDYDAGAGA